MTNNDNFRCEKKNNCTDEKNASKIDSGKSGSENEIKNQLRSNSRGNTLDDTQKLQEAHVVDQKWLIGVEPATSALRARTRWKTFAAQLEAGKEIILQIRSLEDPTINNNNIAKGLRTMTLESFCNGFFHPPNSTSWLSFQNNNTSDALKNDGPLGRDI